MTTIDHVAELRAELAGSTLTKRERADAEAELREAIAALAEVAAEARNDEALAA